MLIELFIEQRTRGAFANAENLCVKCASELLEQTSHLVRARSVAVAATDCVFRARLGEAMGVRGFQYSVVPGKGRLTHMILSLAFPSILEKRVSKGDLQDKDIDDELKRALEWLISHGVQPKFNEKSPHEMSQGDGESQIISITRNLARSGVEFVTEAFKRLIDEYNRSSRPAFRANYLDALSRAIVLTEHNMISYDLHVHGVADVIVEDPETKIAAIIEWKSFPEQELLSSEEPLKTPSVSPTDTAQAYIYALLEAERLGLVGPSTQGGFESYVKAVLGNQTPRPGTGARIIPAVIRPSPTGKSSAIYVKHPLYCESARICDSYELYKELYELIGKAILSAEHLTLTLTDIRRFCSSEYWSQRYADWSHIEEMCKVTTSPTQNQGEKRPIFRVIPTEVNLKNNIVIRLHRFNPLRKNRRCDNCELKDVCTYFLRSNRDPAFKDFMQVKDESWRARFAIYYDRENALMPYKAFSNWARYSNLPWLFSVIKGGLRWKKLQGDYRIDVFDEAIIEENEVVLRRRPLEWEKDRFLFTLREGRPAAIYFNEEHVRSPLHRLSFYGSVTNVEYLEDEDYIVVRVVPTNVPSRMYLRSLYHHFTKRRDVFKKNIVALEVNVNLTQLELLGVTAAEVGTVEKAARAKSVVAVKGVPTEDELLAFYFAGVTLDSSEEKVE